MSEMDEPRGVRNCNPGNVRLGQPWVGLAPMQTDPEFAQFIDAEHGIRALCKTLLTYQDTHGLRTLRGMIYRWAPPEDRNDTDDYLADVCERTGFGPDDAIDLHNPVGLAHMAEAIIAHECENYVYPPGLVDAGVSMALAV
jgi:hypothetical protein